MSQMWNKHRLSNLCILPHLSKALIWTGAMREGSEHLRYWAACDVTPLQVEQATVVVGVRPRHNQNVKQLVAVSYDVEGSWFPSLRDTSGIYQGTQPIHDAHRDLHVQCVVRYWLILV
jgi:hypothetical protein